MPKVSIIIPVFNVEKYLQKCLDSVVAQTLKDIEIVCVDDGSTDASGKILDEYASRDSRFMVIHKENGGYGHSMNVGIDHATGEYIGILESDDFILPQMYEVLYAKAKENDLDLVKSECTYFWESMGYERRIHYDYLDEIFNKVLTAQDRKFMFRFYMNTWTGIYKKSFLVANDIRHSETPGAAYQDNGFWMQTIAMCNRAMWLPESFYMYRQDNPMASVKSQDKALAMYNEYNRVDEIFRKKELHQELMMSHHIRMMRHRGTFLRISDKIKPEYVSVMMDDYKKYREVLYSFDFWPYQKEVNEFFEKFYTNEPEELKNNIEKSRTIRERLAQAKKIVVYGAGKRAPFLFEKLYAAGVMDKVAGICQTQVSEEKVLFGYKVKSLEDMDNLSDSLIIISVSETGKAFSEMEENLKRYGYRDIMCSSALMECIYTV